MHLVHSAAPSAHLGNVRQFTPELILDRLVDVLLGIDELLHLLTRDDAAGLRCIEPHLRQAFDATDAALRAFTD
jgi:hypothetical protein